MMVLGLPALAGGVYEPEIPDPEIPDGSLPEWIVEFLTDPWRFIKPILQAILDFLLNTVVPVAVGLLTAALFLLIAWKVWRWWQRHQRAEGARRIRILPPPDVDPARAESLWMGLHALLPPWWKRFLFGQPRLSWEVVANGDRIEVACWVPAGVPPGLVERAVQVAWPGSRAEEQPADPLQDLRRFRDGAVEACELVLSDAESFPIGGAPEHDPLALALASLAGLADGEACAIQVVAQPATSKANRGLRRSAGVLRTRGKRGALRPQTGTSSSDRPFYDASIHTDIRSVLEKASSPLWRCLLRVAVRAPSRAEARGRIHALAGAFAMFEGRNGFRRRRMRGGLRAMQARNLSRSYLLSVPELARVASLPTPDALPGFEPTGGRTARAPTLLPTDGRVLGRADHAGDGRPVAISVEDARHHIHVIGETGTGKSTLLANMVLQDAVAGRSAVVIDPKGDLVEAILERLPRGADERTCVIDPDDREWAVGLNVLAGDDPDLVADHVLSIFGRIYGPYWGPRTDHIMRSACLTLMEMRGTTLAEVHVLLTDERWRRAVRERLDGTADVDRFLSVYERMPEQQRVHQFAPLMNKLGAFLLRGPVRAILGQADPPLQVGPFLDSGGLLLVRVPKGTLGEDTSRLLGMFVIARVWQECMRRAALPEAERPDTTLYVDEVHNYLALPRSFEDLAAEARGYRLSLVLAHQHRGQLPSDVREALDANARTKVVFTCSPQDAHHLEPHFAPRLTDFDLSHLSVFQAACRPCVNGGQQAAFTFRTEPLPPGSRARAQEVREASRRFARPRAEVDEEIKTRHARPELSLLPGSPRRHPVGRSEGPSTGPSGGRPRAAHPGDDEDEGGGAR